MSARLGILIVLYFFLGQLNAGSKYSHIAVNWLDD